MSDAFLRMHHFTPRVSCCGGKIYPISIRDQMLRGWQYVEAALDRRLIFANDSLPLLIVGSGAAGIAAAIQAANRGVYTLLIGRESQPFRAQRGCATRWVCPTQYDWPVDHHSNGSFPLLPFPPAPPPPPLQWNSGRTDDIVRHWDLQFNAAIQQPPGYVTYLYNTMLVQEPVLAPAADHVLTEITTWDPVTQNASNLMIAARAALLAFGFGRERAFLEDSAKAPLPSRGFPFWSNDRYGLQNFGFQNAVRPSVLISGGGDGALQDFLRAVLSPNPDGSFFARDIYRALDIDPHIEHELQSYAERAVRHYSWGDHDRHDHGHLHWLHRQFEDVVDGLLRDRLVGGPLRVQIRNLFRRPLPRVRLVYKCDHYGNCYALNRFLALLVSRVLEMETGEQVVYDGRRVSWIQGANRHVCNGNPLDCHGSEHDVFLELQPLCWNSPGPSAPPDPARNADFQANVLILRHGVSRNDFEEQVSPYVGRHLLPFSAM